MGRKVENLTGGLVTDRDPALLKPGQLADIRNFVYKNGATHLERAPGRASFGQVSAVATGVVGLRDITFDNNDRYLVAMAGTKYRYSAVGATGTFADLATITAGTSLEVIQYRNRYFLMNGASANVSSIGTNTVVYLSATAAGTAPSTRTHGLLQVVAAPNVTTGSGGFSQTATGFYEYWTTEVARYTQDGATASVESAFSSDNGVTTQQVTSTAVVPTIQLPAVRNAATTHWRVYRSPMKSRQADKEFPTGFMIAELATGVSSHADTTALASASSFPASVNTSGFFFGWASASSVFSDNAVYASATNPSPLVSQQQGIYGFSLGAVSGSIKGIVVEIEAYVSSGSAPVPVTAYLGVRRSDGAFTTPIWPALPAKSGQITSTSSAAPTLLTLGSSTDRWTNTAIAPLLNDSDFSTSNFMVMIESSKPSTSLGIDFVRVTVYYSGSVDSTVVYPTVAYTFGDIISQVSKNFPAPSSITGDLFQDSLVVNDVANPSLIRYSFPGETDAFPPTYYLDFETRDNDQVRCIRVVNGRLVVGLDSSLWRVNYLPNERDASFDRGKATDAISRSCGIVNAMCACTFTIDGQTEQLAFISNKGLHTTDGYNFITRSKNQDWRQFISLVSTSTCIALVNDPETRNLRFYYRNDSLGNETYMCLWASYDPGDIDGEGNFKFSGPVHMRNYESGGGTYASVESVCSVPLSTGNTGIYIGYGGTSTAAGAGSVYYETGTTIPSNDSTARYVTRRMYEGGLSGEWMLDDLFGYTGSYAGSPVVTYTFSGTKTNDAGPTQRGSKTITLGGQLLHRTTPKVQVEGLQITATVASATTFRTEMIVLGSTDFGIEDSGR